MTVSVLFVCLGNICRSPTAHGVFEQRAAEQGLADKITVDSSGTGDWHVGHEPDSRSMAAAAKRGYDLSALRARQVIAADFSSFDYILAMDHSNLSDLQAMSPANYAGELALFLHYGKNCSTEEVPDPYYGSGDGFNRVLDLVEEASEGLLQHIVQKHKL